MLSCVPRYLEEQISTGWLGQSSRIPEPWLSLLSEPQEPRSSCTQSSAVLGSLHSTPASITQSDEEKAVLRSTINHQLSKHCLGQQGEMVLPGPVQCPAQGAPGSRQSRNSRFYWGELAPKPCLLGHPSRRENASPYVFSRRQLGLTDSNEMMYSKKCSIHGKIMSVGEGS